MDLDMFNPALDQRDIRAMLCVASGGFKLKNVC